MEILSASALDPKNPKPGVYKGVPFDTYVAIEALNNSSIQAYLDSGSFRAMRLAMTEPSAASAATRVGTLLHLMMLEPEKFAERVVTGGPINPKTGEEYGQDTKAWANFEEANPGKIIMPKGKVDALAAMIESVVKHPEAKRLLVDSGKRTVREATVVWDQKFNILEDDGEVVPSSVLCKGRVDCLLLDEPTFADLKTTRQPLTYEAIGREFAHFGYYRAAWMYGAGLAAIHPGEYANYFVIVQNVPPYECVVATCPDEVLNVGKAEVHEMLPGYAGCLKSGRWLSAGQRWDRGRLVRDIMPVELPRWKLANFSDGD